MKPVCGEFLKEGAFSVDKLIEEISYICPLHNTRFYFRMSDSNAGNRCFQEQGY